MYVRMHVYIIASLYKRSFTRIRGCFVYFQTRWACYRTAVIVTTCSFDLSNCIIVYSCNCVHALPRIKCIRCIYWPYVALLAVYCGVRRCRRRRIQGNRSQMRTSKCACLIFGVSIGLDPG